MPTDVGFAGPTSPSVHNLYHRTTVKKSMTEHKNNDIYDGPNFDLSPTNPEIEQKNLGVVDQIGTKVQQVAQQAAPKMNAPEIKADGFFGKILNKVPFLSGKPVVQKALAEFVLNTGILLAMNLLLGAIFAAIAAAIWLGPKVVKIAWRGGQHAQQSIQRRSETLSMVQLYIDVRKKFAPSGRLPSELDDVALVDVAAKHGFDATTAQRLVHALNSERNLGAGKMTLATALRALEPAWCKQDTIPVEQFAAKNTRVAETLEAAGLPADAFAYRDAAINYQGFWSLRNWTWTPYAARAAWIDDAVAAQNLEGLRQAVAMPAGRNRSDVYLALAHAELRAGRVDPARTHFKAAVDKAANSGAMQYACGQFEAQHGTWKNALPYYQAAMALGHTDAKHAVAQHHVATGDAETACTLMTELTQVAPNTAAYHRTLAAAQEALYRAGVAAGQPVNAQRDAAMASWNAAIRLDDTCAEAHYKLAGLQAPSSEAAMISYERAVRWDRNNVDYLTALQACFKQLGRDKAAERCAHRIAYLTR